MEIGDFFHSHQGKVSHAAVEPINDRSVYPDHCVFERYSHILRFRVAEMDLLPAVLLLCPIFRIHPV
jgi:hypothetical protein